MARDLEDWQLPQYWGINDATGHFGYSKTGGRGLVTARALTISGPEDPMPAEHVVGFAEMRRAVDESSDDSRGRRTLPDWLPDARAVQTATAYRWDDASQAAFESVWTSRDDEIVDQLISEVGSCWPDRFADQATVLVPELVGRLTNLAERGQLPIRASGNDRPDYANARTVVDMYALRNGPYAATVKRRIWAFPTIRTCDACGAEHYLDLVHRSLIRLLRYPGVCPVCSWAAWYSTGSYPSVGEIDLPLDSALARYQQYVALAGALPGTVGDAVVNIANPGLRRGEVIAARFALPTIDEMRVTYGFATRLAVFQAAEIVGDHWRPAMGTYCTAIDGHPCRSLAEQAVCDWLFRNDIAHEIDPLWPKHDIYNPSGRRRADWKVGTTYIEYAGMLSQPSYNARMSSKRALADEIGIDLIVLTPDHLTNLPAALAYLTHPAARA